MILFPTRHPHSRYNFKLGRPVSRKQTCHETFWDVCEKDDMTRHIEGHHFYCHGTMQNDMVSSFFCATKQLETRIIKKGGNVKKSTRSQGSSVQALREEGGLQDGASHIPAWLSGPNETSVFLSQAEFYQTPSLEATPPFALCLQYKLTLRAMTDTFDGLRLGYLP